MPLKLFILNYYKARVYFTCLVFILLNAFVSLQVFNKKSRNLEIYESEQKRNYYN